MSFPPSIKVFIVNFCGKKAKTREERSQCSTGSQMSWPLLTALTRPSFQNHNGSLSEMRHELSGAPITLTEEVSAVAGSLVAFNSSSMIPNATLGGSQLVLTLVFVCHCLKNHTMVCARMCLVTFSHNKGTYIPLIFFLCEYYLNSTLLGNFNYTIQCYKV